MVFSFKFLLELTVLLTWLDSIILKSLNQETAKKRKRSLLTTSKNQECVVELMMVDTDDIHYFDWFDWISWADLHYSFNSPQFNGLDRGLRFQSSPTLISVKQKNIMVNFLIFYWKESLTLNMFDAIFFDLLCDEYKTIYVYY